MINEVIPMLGLSELTINWSKFSIRENTYNSTHGRFKTGRISTGYNWVTTSEEPFQSGSTAIMIVDEVSYREI